MDWHWRRQASPEEVWRCPEPGCGWWIRYRIDATIEIDEHKQSHKKHKKNGSVNEK